MKSASTAINLIEIGPRTATGYSSGAHRCLGEDGRYYYVKSLRLAGARAVVAEWLAAGMAEAMKLPVREAALVHIPSELITADLSSLGHGLAFGSLELAHADGLSFAGSATLPASLRAEVLLFDYWIHNADRVLGPGGGNPNLLVASGQPMALIDHGNGFDPEFDSALFFAHHAFADCRVEWLEAPRRLQWEARAQAATRGIPSLWDSLPEEWLENAHGEIQHDMTLENVLFLVNQYSRDPSAFWLPFLST